MQRRCPNKDLVVVLSSLQTNRNKLKGSKDFNWNNIGLTPLWFVRFCIAGTQDSGWFLADLLSGHVSTIILMRKCDSKYKEFFFLQSFCNNSEPKNITNPCLPRVASRRLVLIPFVEILNVDISYRQNLQREGERERKTAHGGRITKIVDCLRIVFGLPYNYKPNLSLTMI